MYRRAMSLAQRFSTFVDAGLLRRVPTRWQLLQGEIEMTPYVISTDATSEEGYRAHAPSHPLVRQLLLLAHVGPDHLRTGSALGAKLGSICAHLILTLHRGMPVFDLQIVQTHERGLVHLGDAIDATLAASTPAGRRRWRLVSTLLQDPRAYLEQFLGTSGWIARAERFDYPAPSDESSKFPPEFWSLVELARYSEATFPAHPRDIPLARLPAHLLHLAGRRGREGRRMGWFGDHRR